MGVLGPDRVDPNKMIEGLGNEWLLTNIWVKKYPCCFSTHRQIDIIRKLKQKYNLSIEDVNKIEVHASPPPRRTV